ncbi:hypothetical protein MKW98_012030 [Papaver atlanticum]|uniref:Leucine-rich repeat-containing N-terminal plant-type domain-containing protein n=1 Tax=Papaver atlanticum TaxID=357466 RepID=A0AAD4SNM6_9MAGN|nr:hypothetical protein MKW98_012030 [Papaver atlanticum]
MVSNVVVAVKDDIRCLKGVKASFKDPQGTLDSWVFNTSSLEGYVCVFSGVECWNTRENRVYGLQLPSSKLSGQVPNSLQYCGSLQILDLSGNNISGTIPSQICTWLPYLVNLDLSGNQLSGSIPAELVECKYLNRLILSNNRLSGQIPSQFSSLVRLRDFAVADNHFSGQIPSFMSNFSAAGFEGNDGLCGKPLAACGYGL